MVEKIGPAAVSDTITLGDMLGVAAGVLLLLLSLWGLAEAIRRTLTFLSGHDKEKEMEKSAEKPATTPESLQAHICKLVAAGYDVCRDNTRLYFSRYSNSYVLLRFAEKNGRDVEYHIDSLEEAACCLITGLPPASVSVPGSKKASKLATNPE